MLIMDFIADCKLEIEILSTKIANLFATRTISSGEKVLTIKYYKNKFSINNFVETGTYIGDTLWSLKDGFENLVSIELSRVLYRRAKRRFSGIKKVKLINGDSGEEIEKILKKIKQPTLFWLDAHWSGGSTAMADKRTPIVRELEAILRHKIKNHVVLIDDADMFNGEFDYPAVLEVRKTVKKLAPRHSISVKDSIIRIIPASKKK